MTFAPASASALKPSEAPVTPLSAAMLAWLAPPMPVKAPAAYTLTPSVATLDTAALALALKPALAVPETPSTRAM